jgi:hypothetical protein
MIAAGDSSIPKTASSRTLLGITAAVRPARLRRGSSVRSMSSALPLSSCKASITSSNLTTRPEVGICRSAGIDSMAQATAGAFHPCDVRVVALALGGAIEKGQYPLWIGR